MSAGFGIRSLVTQIYPLSMLMYFLLFNPLLMKFDEAFSSLRLNTEAKKVVVIVYANDWNITLTDPTDIPLLHNIL
jgi:CRISPR/Cas system CMR-associated protein Cmr3 (group 5 of RAMP superfamily)